MRYMLLIYTDETAGEDLPQEQREATRRGWFEYTKWLQDKGWMLAGEPLQETAHATCVRNDRGERLVTDGPYAETKEQLGGLAVIDVADEQAARVWAGKIAVACGWPQEVRRFRHATDPSRDQ
jgi:hypothetical protein